MFTYQSFVYNLLVKTAMKKLIVLSIMLLLGASLHAQNIPVYESFDQYQPLLEKNNDTTYVINYWATYCAPCIEEMQVFRKLEQEYSNKPVKIILTSLDFGSNAKERVRSFISKHQVRSKVVILDDPRSNAWINKVSTKWSGALPGTLVYNQNSRSFYEKTFNYQELKNIIESKMNKP